MKDQKRIKKTVECNALTKHQSDMLWGFMHTGFWFSIIPYGILVFKYNYTTLYFLICLPHLLGLLWYIRFKLKNRKITNYKVIDNGENKDD